MASVVAAGGSTEACKRAAIDAVETLTPLPYSRAQLDDDLGAPDLDNRLRGDLILLSEQLEPRGLDALLRHAASVATSDGGPTTKQTTIINSAASFLGRTSFQHTQRQPTS